MDFTDVLQLKEKKFWWIDVLFYLAVSLFVAAVICYFVFLIKNAMQREDIKNQISAIEAVGTEQQREGEKTVLSYQNKIVDYADILKNHQFASNVFAFMENETMENVWFDRFVLNKKNATIELTGESDNQESFSKQLSVFEKNEYVKDVSLINSKLGDNTKVQFSLSLALDSKIFNYISNNTPANEN